MAQQAAPAGSIVMALVVVLALVASLRRGRVALICLSRAGDRIGRRLDELAGDRSGPELDLVNRLVRSFLARAPRHLAALREAFDRGDPVALEEQAHSLKGAAGNLGAEAVAEVCARLEDQARDGVLPPDLRQELDRLDRELTAAGRRLQPEVRQDLA